jgi:Rhodopirellula transposase DDE domain
LFGTNKNLSKAAIKRRGLRRSKPSRPLPKVGEGRKRSTRSPPATWSYSTIDPRLLGRLQATGAGDDQRDHDPFRPQGSRRVGQSAYPLGVKVSDRELAAVPMRQHDWHGEWNYTVQPTAP